MSRNKKYETAPFHRRRQRVSGDMGLDAAECVDELLGIQYPVAVQVKSCNQRARLLDRKRAVRIPRVSSRLPNKEGLGGPTPLARYPEDEVSTSLLIHTTDTPRPSVAYT